MPIFKKPKVKVEKRMEEDLEIKFTLSIPREFIEEKEVQVPKVPKPETRWVCAKCGTPIELKGISEPVVCPNCGSREFERA